MRIRITTLAPHGNSWWVEPAEDLVTCTWKHYEILKKNFGEKPTCTKVGKKNFIVLPKGMTSMVLEEV